MEEDEMGRACSVHMRGSSPRYTWKIIFKWAIKLDVDGIH
jgi:hypothetical protein